MDKKETDEETVKRMREEYRRAKEEAAKSGEPPARAHDPGKFDPFYGVPDEEGEKAPAAPTPPADEPKRRPS